MLAIFYQLFEVFYAGLIDPKSFKGVSEYLLTFICQKLNEFLLDPTVKLLYLCLGVFQIDLNNGPWLLVREQAPNKHGGLCAFFCSHVDLLEVLFKFQGIEDFREEF